jgi:phage tail-like protein
MRSQTIKRLLPAAYQRAANDETVLAALLDVMEVLQEPDEELIGDFDAQFAPYTARDDFLAFLARWVALDHLVGVRRPGSSDPLLIPPTQMRHLIADAAVLAQVRGTSDGIRSFLEIATGVRGFEIVETPDQPFHFTVRVPAEARAYVGVVKHIVNHEKPAATTADIQVKEATA